MKCPHCLREIHSGKTQSHLKGDKDGEWFARHEQCPACKRLIIEVECRRPGASAWRIAAYPKTSSRVPPSEYVPSKFADDYKEACAVLGDSPKASAALSRRCLQNLLREKEGVKKTNLADEIQEVLDSMKLPSHLADGIDAVRNTGNFAAHPMKSTSTGEVVDVEPGEAEWNLDVLEGLFDFYFVQPTVMKERRKALNKKLKDVGKPPMK